MGTPMEIALYQGPSKTYVIAAERNPCQVPIWYGDATEPPKLLKLVKARRQSMIAADFSQAQSRPIWYIERNGSVCFAPVLLVVFILGKCCCNLQGGLV